MFILKACQEVRLAEESTVLSVAGTLTDMDIDRNNK